MRHLSRLLLGAAAVAAIGGAALAADRTHVLRVAMPDGSVARIRYVGDVPPRLVVAPAAPAAVLPVGLFGGEGSPFAMLDAMAAEMDRQGQAMMRQVAALSAAAPAPGGAIDPAALAQAPAGMMSYTMVSYASGAGGSCRQSVQVTALRPGEAPKVIQQSAGDCRAMSRAPIPAVERAPQPAAPAITRVRYVPGAARPKPTPII